MSIERFTGVGGFLALYRGLRVRLPGDLAARDAAAEAFERLGFPGRRDEAWKYTNVRPLAEVAFHEPLSTVEDNRYLAGVPRVAEKRLVFVDGRYRPDLSDAAPAWFRSFQDEPGFGVLVRPDRDVMVALNTMLAEDGARLAVPEGVDAGMIQIAAVNGSGG
ncbi:MAG: Fe-S cluster assembly protein SufD, partial [Acetobacteraceae bacterium]|nr:Fe-S cluster assembly protein SufD [Acetobacteraceae bacterium]